MIIEDETGEAIDARLRVVARARSYLGPNDAPKDQDPCEFFRIFAPMYGPKEVHSKAWCGIFAGACLVLEGLWPADAKRWVDSKGFVLASVAAGLLRVVDVPRPGDVVLFGAPLWHHAIVDLPGMVGGKVHTIDGNSIGNLGLGPDGQPREGCSKKVHTVDHATVFYSIAPLIS
jgi:hypothetical protein